MGEMRRGVYPVVKRVLDLITAAFILIVLSPFLLLIACLVKAGSKGPVFYTQVRPGKDRKLFKIYKFRTMVQGADAHQVKGVEVTSLDSRVTEAGWFLRRFKIDELAQLVNILKGDMSFVGPRPSLPDYLDDYEDWEEKRFAVRPGLTGLAQVNGNIYLERRERSLFDVSYVSRMSFLMDLRIVLKTVAIVIFGEEKFVRKQTVREEHG